MQLLATCSCGLSGGQGKKALTNVDLASTAQQSDTLHFHTEILFKRILVSKYLRMFMEKREEEPRLALCPEPTPGDRLRSVVACGAPGLVGTEIQPLEAEMGTAQPGLSVYLHTGRSFLGPYGFTQSFRFFRQRSLQLDVCCISVCKAVYSTLYVDAVFLW